MMSVPRDHSFSSSKWINIQEPVKDILQSLSKAIHTQAIDIQAIDTRLNEKYIPSDKLEGLLLDLLNGLISKDESKEILHKIEEKANNNDIRLLDNRLTLVLCCR